MDNKTTNSSFLDPKRIVTLFGLKSGDHAADFGAGHGYFTIAMAHAVGGDGKIYAIDIQKPVLEIIRAKARIEHLLNIEYIWADLDQYEGSKLKDGFLDFVIIANILFQAEQKKILAREAFRILRSNGRIAVIEWGASPASMGPPSNLRIPKEEALQFFSEEGFTLDREFAAGAHHYGLIFIKT